MDNSSKKPSTMSSCDEKGEEIIFNKLKFHSSLETIVWFEKSVKVATIKSNNLDEQCPGL